jgi:Prokaryotic dksA/traR C4-type zinc finger
MMFWRCERSAAFDFSMSEEILEARRRALPGARTCIACQAAIDRRPANIGINRRGSKDSQLK